METMMGYPRFGLQNTKSFTKVWDDGGSRAKLDFGIWRPQPAPFGFIGDYPVDGHGDPTGYGWTAYIHTILDDDPANPALKPPLSLEPIWSFPVPTWGLEAKVICRPVAPPGYIACGFAGTTARPGEDLTKLHIPGLMCVRSDLTRDLYNPPHTPGKPPTKPAEFDDYFVWNDHGSRLPKNVSVYLLRSHETGIATMWAAPKYMTSKDHVSSYETIRRGVCFPVT